MKAVNVARARAGSRRKRTVAGALLGVIALIALGAFWLTDQESHPVKVAQSAPAATGSQTGRFPFKVVKPGPGDMAPPIRLTTTAGAPYDLDALRGKTVLVYFQEGLMCDACWEQLKAIEANFNRFRLIGITSVVGVTGNPGQANYTASKAGMIGMFKSIGKEYAKRGVTANCIAPGFIATPMTDKLNDKQKEAILAMVPAGKLGTGADVAAAAVYLASDEAAYVNGQTLHVNGGMAMI